jgi:cellulose 1,4-beta-cellobiosidase
LIIDKLQNEKGRYFNMKRHYIYFLVCFIALITLTSCGGGGGGSSSSDSGTSIVTIAIGESNQTTKSAASSIPTSVYKIVFTISAPDMDTITREVINSGQSSITESFIVPNGSNRYFLIEAKDTTGRVLYEGSTYTNLDGSDVTLDINMVAMGTVLSAPTGVSALAGNQQVTVSWSAVTGATGYNVYMASESGVTKDNYGTKPDGNKYSAITTTSYTVTGLTNGKTYYFVVTALDSLGESTESSEVSATPSNEPPQPPG